jgi:type IV pilus assembly protein PilW
MMRTIATGTSRPRQRGFTLIELMIAMMLGLMILSIVAALFEGTSRGRTEIERSDRLVESAQNALETLAEEVRHAGFYGELNFTGVAWQLPSPCAVAAADLGYGYAPYQLPVAVRGYLGDEDLPPCIANRRAGTAALTLRRVDVATTPQAQAKNAAFMQVSKCNKDIPPYWKVNSASAEFTLRNIDCATTADIRRVLVRTYYVATCNECGTDTVPTLKRVELDGDKLVETPIAEGIENLQVEYGFDMDGDGIADRYRNALSGDAGAADNDWSNVVATRIHVVARSTEGDRKYSASVTKRFDFGQAGGGDAGNDAYHRTMLSALVRIPNVAGKRENP